MPADLASLGYTRQVCIDFSATVVEVMSEQHRDIADISWDQTDLWDVGALAFSKATSIALFSATFDAMIYGSGWNPPAEVKENTTKYLAEVHRVLKDDGMIICVSFPQPHFIRPLLAANGLWDAEVRVLNGGNGCLEKYAWILTKKKAEVSSLLVSPVADCCITRCEANTSLASPILSPWSAGMRDWAVDDLTEAFGYDDENLVAQDCA